MNKRIKLKKGILKKRCDDNCQMHSTIVREKFTTCNGCIGCIHRAIAEKMCEENEKFWNSMTYKEKQKYNEEKALSDIAFLSNKDFSERVKKEFHSKDHRYNFQEYLKILNAIRRILILHTKNEELIMKHMISEVNKRFYSDFITSR